MPWAMHRWTIASFILASHLIAGASYGQEPAQPDSATSTEWRDDAANLQAVRLINEAYRHMPFSREFEGVLNECPLRIDWEIGPNLPAAWKGGVAGVFGDEIVLAGGLWMPQRENLAYAFHIRSNTYRPLPAPPVRPQYTQGAGDGDALYVVGGRGTGRRVYKLTRDGNGRWAWHDFTPLPEAEGDGRWLATVSIIPGRWLFLVSGHPTGTPSERRDRAALPDYRLRLDRPDAAWETMAPYPGGLRALVMSAAVGGKLYVFGGSHPEPVMRQNHQELASKYGLRAPYNGVPNYRDAYRYDPDGDRWTSIRNVPFPVLAGHAVALRDRYIVLLGSADVPTYRVGKSSGRQDPFWTGYGDRILCYDTQLDNYSHVGVMPYGVATSHWTTDGMHLYSFGGEPAHGYNLNTENVLQIGTIRWRDGN
jgi:hypothetical protein